MTTMIRSGSAPENNVTSDCEPGMLLLGSAACFDRERQARAADHAYLLALRLLLARPSFPQLAVDVDAAYIIRPAHDLARAADHLLGARPHRTPARPDCKAQNANKKSRAKGRQTS